MVSAQTMVKPRFSAKVAEPGLDREELFFLYSLYNKPDSSQLTNDSVLSVASINSKLALLG